MKICLLNHNQIGQGTYYRCYHFGKALVNLGHSVTLLTTSRKYFFKQRVTVDKGVNIIEFPDFFRGRLRNGFCVWNAFQRALFLYRKNFDIIHAFDCRPVVILPALSLKYRKKIPLIIDWADWWGRGGTTEERSGHLFAKSFGRIEQFFEEYFRQFANYSTVICTALKQRLEGLGYDGDRITVIPQGSRVEVIKPLSIEFCRKKLSLDKNVNIVGHLGTLFNNDAKLLFDAMKYVQDENCNTKLLLIGRHKLKLSAFNYGHNLLIESGEIDEDEIQYYLGACDILVLPMKKTIANNGRWPSKINDYLCAERAIISTPISDIGTIFNDNEIGVLAEDNPDTFGEAILNILDDKEKQKLLAKRARKYAETELTWKELTRQLENIYLRALSEHKEKSNQQKIKNL